jgi:uncharacterized protein
MLIRHEYPAGVACWVDVSTPDLDGTMRFYGGVFGWEFADRTPSGSSQPYYVAQLDGKDVAGVGSPVDGLPPEPTWHMYVAVTSAEEAAARAESAGGRVIHQPVDLPGAGRTAVLADPAGAEFRVWEAAGRPGAQRVNEPGTWNFNDLNTRDVDAAKVFYGTVLGWRTSTVNFGSETSTMWQVAGYGDFLETINPGTRARHAEPGVPAGFSDAVAWMQVLTAETPTGNTPHWSVTFAVADPDDTADRAAALDGEVIVPPFDASSDVRVAVLGDPYGAAFVVSRYAPGG